MSKQKELDGMERPTIKEIEEAAEDYVDARDRRMKMTEKEVACKSVLLQLMIKHESELSKNGEGELIYRYEDEEVRLLPGKANVKVKAVHDTDEDDN